MSTIIPINAKTQTCRYLYNRSSKPSEGKAYQGESKKDPIIKNALIGCGAGFISGFFASMFIDSGDISNKLMAKTWGGGAAAGVVVGLAKGFTYKFANNDKAANIVGGLGYGAIFGALSGIVLRETFQLEKKVSSQKAGKVGGFLGAGAGTMMSLLINQEDAEK